MMIWRDDLVNLLDGVTLHKFHVCLPGFAGRAVHLDDSGCSVRL